MTKSFIIDPVRVRAAGRAEFPRVPINQYAFDLSTEPECYGTEGMMNILHDMIVACALESMLDSIKKTGEWQDIAYNHEGPAHLGIG